MKSIKTIIKSAITVSIIFWSYFAQSQTLSETIRMAENERYESAKESFRKLVNTDPDKAKVYFYFGETYFEQAMYDSADMMYKKGISSDSNFILNYVGIGKVLWNTNYQNEAEKYFNKALAKTKSKNALILMKIAENFINSKNKNLPYAKELLTKAQKLEPKNPEIHILIGDALLEENQMDGSGPIKKYNEAAELDKNLAKPILRIGKLYYRAKNPTEALKWYKEAIKIDSTFAPAYIVMGELYLMAGFNKQALEQYKKYLALNNDPEARNRFAQILWVNKLYEDAINEIVKIQQSDSSSLYLYRVLGYSYSEVGDKFPPDGYVKGLYAINKFFQLASEIKDFKFLSSDFSAKGKLLSKNMKDSLAMIELLKAVQLDTTNTDLYSDIALAYYKVKKFNEAILYLNKKIAAGKPTVNDYIYLGLSYYLSKQYLLADSAFKTVTNINSENYNAQKFRAKSNAMLDPETKLGLAKPFYEKMVELILSKPETLEKNKKDLIEAYEYLAYYYYVNKEIDKSKDFVSKIKELDSANKKLEFFNKLFEEKKKSN
ncbi:MAG: tetratricopeptide repeat protein [Bacteroidetes bacterium]|nr:tetratricopeptide repeat protein [Bacteroidota bacterium]